MTDNAIELARRVAKGVGLDPALVCAIVEQESSWDSFAVRYEQGFFDCYVQPSAAGGAVRPSTSTEARCRAFSWGLMQIMGQCAREMGFDGPYLSELLEPAIGLQFGCKLLARKLELAGGDVERALDLWNGGANPAYSSQVMARIEKYRNG